MQTYKENFNNIPLSMGQTVTVCKTPTELTQKCEACSLVSREDLGNNLKAKGTNLQGEVKVGHIVYHCVR